MTGPLADNTLRIGEIIKIRSQIGSQGEEKNMAILDGQKVIAIEEHYYDEDMIKHFTGVDARTGGLVMDKLLEVGEERLKDMDACGIDVALLSHGAPSTQRMDAETAIPVAKAANDHLAEIVKAHPDRYAGFANLPTMDPQASADELKRCVEELGFKGTMIHGLIGPDRLFPDNEMFWPIYAQAEALDMPIYIHPANPHPTVADIYIKDYVEKYPGFMNAGWGFTMETATIAIRMVLSGVFDKHPNLKVVLGHLGETLPFLVWRIDHVLNRPGNDGVEFRKIFTNNFYITTSGFFSNPALLCCIQEMGTDHILFAIDYPFVANQPGPVWMERLMLNSEDKAKILHGNAERLFNM